MIRSSVTTSGFSSAIFSSASSPSRATPTTSRSVLTASVSRSTLRANAESSTTRTRDGPLGGHDVFSYKNTPSRSSQRSSVPNRSSDSEMPTSSAPPGRRCRARLPTTRRAVSSAK